MNDFSVYLDIYICTAPHSVESLSSIIPKMYIDLEWVANEYFIRCKKGLWTKEEGEDAVKCWNLERVINAELLGLRRPNHESTLDELLKEKEENKAIVGKKLVGLLN